MKSYTLQILSAFPLIRNKVWMPALFILFQHSTGSLSQCNRKRKRNNRQTDWIRRNKTISIFVYTKNPKESIKKKKPLRTNMTIQQGHSISYKYKNQLYFHTSNEHEHIDTKIKSIIPLTIDKKVKYLCVNLTKHVQYLYYSENNKTGEINKVLSKWSNSCPWITGLNK